MALVLNGSGSISGLSVGGLPAGTVTVSDLSATGTPSSTTFLRGDGAWAQAGFESGTMLVFSQTNAPTGWTKATSHDNKALRVVSGTVSSGGSVAFTTAFASQTPSGSVSVSGTVGGTTLSTSQIPSHNHIQGLGSDGGVVGRYGNVTGLSSVRIDYDGASNNGTQAVYTSSTGSGGSHDHSFSGSGSFSGSAINLAVQYVDVILAVKD